MQIPAVLKFRDGSTIDMFYNFSSMEEFDNWRTAYLKVHTGLNIVAIEAKNQPAELAPLAQEWLSASKVCAFEPAEGTAFTHRWDGFEVESDAGHVPSFPMAGKWGMSSGADDYGRTTFRNPLTRG